MYRVCHRSKRRSTLRMLPWLEFLSLVSLAENSGTGGTQQINYYLVTRLCFTHRHFQTGARGPCLHRPKNKIKGVVGPAVTLDGVFSTDANQLESRFSLVSPYCRRKAGVWIVPNWSGHFLFVLFVSLHIKHKTKKEQRGDKISQSKFLYTPQNVLV